MSRARHAKQALFGVAVVIFAAFGSAASAEPSDRIARIISAYGGEEALERVHQMESEWAGYSIGRYQSRHTDPPYDRLPVRNWSAFDFRTARSVVDSIGNYPGELNFGTRAINDGRRRLTLNTISNIYVDGGMFTHEGMVASATNRMPWLLVREMAAHPEQFVPAEARPLRGITYDVLRRGESDILVHPETSLIYAVSSRGENMTDVEIEVMRTYTHYFRHDGVMLNRRHQVWNNDDVVVDLELHAVAFNQPIDAHLALPEGFKRVTTLDGYDGDETVIRKLGGGVYLAGAGETRILYIEFDDHFVAMEAGDMPDYTEATYNAMRRHMGGKPLRYIIPTHHHDDHAAAIHFYSRVGAAILTTRDKEGFMRRLLSRAWGGNPPVTNARFRFIDAPRFVLEDKTNRLDVHVIADAPHSENMLVGYLPNKEFLYTCDIFIGWIGEVRQGASYGARHLAEWVSRRREAGDIGPVEDYATCHGRPYAAAEFDRMIATERTIVTLPGDQRFQSARWFQRYGLSDDTTGDPRRNHAVDAPALH